MGPVDAEVSTYVHAEDLEQDPHRAALEANPEKPEKLTLATCLSILFLALGFVSPLTAFLLPATVLVQIGTSLGDTTNIVWLPGGWSIASSVAFSIAGNLSDIFGRRYVTLCGQALSIVGAAVAGTANTTTVAVAGTTISGFAAGIVFVAYAGIAELLPNKWRNVGLSTTEFVVAVPWAVCGVIITTQLVAHATWRWCYFIGLVYAVIAFIGTAIVYFPPARPSGDYSTTRWQQVKNLDYIGLLLYTAGLTIFLVGITWAGSDAHPWKSVSVIAPIVLGAVTFVACFVYDFTLASHPFFPLDLFRRIRQFTILLVLVFVSGMIFYSMASLLPQGTLYMYTSNLTDIGLTQLPNGLAQLVGGCIMPAISHKIKHLKVQIIVALTIQTLFTALYTVAIPNNRAAWMAFQFFGMGCFGYITLLCYFTAGLHVPLSELGLASGLIGTFRSAGGSVGNAIFATILKTDVNEKLAGAIANAAIAVGYPAKDLAALIPAVIENALGVPGLTELPGVTPAVVEATSRAFKDTYAHAFRLVFYATIPFGIVAIIASLWIEDASKYLTNHTAVHLEHGPRMMLTRHEGRAHSEPANGPGETIEEKSLQA